MRWGLLWTCASACALFVGACKPASVNDAEAKGDVGYLVANGSPEAVAALGRLADSNDKARAAVETRAENDLNAYIAAWGAVQRGAAWGTALLKSGLAQPSRAELAAAAMTRGDPKLAPFVPDLANALVAAGKEPRVTVAAILASSNAAPVVAERLRDKTTRANMCRGLASPDASPAARGVFLSAPEESRDDPMCIDSVVRMATYDDTTLAWLAQSGEPGLLSGAGKADGMPCPRVAKLWAQTIDVRPAAAHGGLAVPLAHAIKRCPKELDDVLDAALAKNPGVAAPLVVAGVDPFGPETRQLTKTCKAMAGPALRFVSGRTKDRAADTLANGCKGAPRR